MIKFYTKSIQDWDGLEHNAWVYARDGEEVCSTVMDENLHILDTENSHAPLCKRYLLVVGNWQKDSDDLGDLERDLAVRADVTPAEAIQLRSFASRPVMPPEYYLHEVWRTERVRSLDALTDLYQEFCDWAYLPAMSADELLCEDLPTYQSWARPWLAKYVEVWEALDDVNEVVRRPLEAF